MIGFPRFAGIHGGGGNRTRVGFTPETVVLQELRWACMDAYRAEDAFLADLTFRVRDLRDELEQGADTRLYVVFDEDAAKIGVAADPVKRSRHLQISNHRPLILYASAPATKALEEFAHGLLGEWRIRGEWFRASGPVMAFAELMYAAGEQCELMDENECGPCDVTDTVSILCQDMLFEEFELLQAGEGWAA